MATTIICNKCGNKIEITEAIRKDLEQKVLKEIEVKHTQEIEELKQQQTDLVKRNEVELEKAKIEITANTRKEANKKLQKEFKIQLKEREEDAKRREKQYQQSQKQLIDLTKQLREAKGAESKIKLEFERKLLAEQGKIKSDAKKEVEEELSLRIAEKDKKINDAQKQIRELERKIHQGSQQLQGEVLELKLEEILKQTFPFDEIKEVPKGIKGADVIQVVKTRTGMKCGTIVWESKNTKNWSSSWVQKLIEDQRALKAEIAVLVSSVLPEDIQSFGQINNIWVSDLKSAIALTYALRQQLIGIKSAQEINNGKSTKAEVVYKYLTSNEFKQRIEVWVEYFKERQGDLQKERLYFNKKWSKEEKEIHKVFESTASMYGDLQGLIGAALPKVKYLELPDNTSGESD